jgi:hypothetical protein
MPQDSSPANQCLDQLPPAHCTLFCAQQQQQEEEFPLALSHPCHQGKRNLFGTGLSIPSVSEAVPLKNKATQNKKANSFLEPSATWKALTALVGTLLQGISEFNEDMLLV